MLAPGYALTKPQLETLRKLVIGLPITYEHSGVFKAVENVSNRKQPLLPALVQAELEALALQDVTAKPIGTIIDFWETPAGNWWITFKIDALRYEGILDSYKTIRLSILTFVMCVCTGIIWMIEQGTKFCSNLYYIRLHIYED